jgi:hypothetical protein
VLEAVDQSGDMVTRRKDGTMEAKTIRALLTLLVFALILSSCNPGGVARPAQTQTALAEAIGLPQTLAAGGTAVAQLTLAASGPTTQVPTTPAIPSATSVPPTAPAATVPATVAPSATVQPTAIPPTAAPTSALPTPYPTPRPGPITRISFQAGTTSANVEGVIRANAQVRYRVRALAQQIMMVMLDTPNGDLYMAIRGESDGRDLLSADAKSSYFRGPLPRTQDYRITIYGSEAETHYNLSVIIPKRISFRSGATSARLEGNVGAQTVINYVARARAGQTMTVTVTAPTNDVLLTIYGLDDGQPLVRAASGATNWSGTLPGTQDYAIDVVGTDAARKYTLDVEIK